MTQTMILFISLCLALAFCLAWVVIYPWVKGSSADDNRLMALNTETFYERLDELELDKARAVISDDFYQAQVIDLKRQLLAAQQATPSVLPASIKSRLIVLLWIPTLSAMLYLLAGDRVPVFTLWSAQDKVGQVADDLLTAKIDEPPAWAIEDSTALISAMQTNVHHHAYDANRWMRLSELLLSLEANAQALEALARAYRLEPDNDDIASTYAQIRFFTSEGKLDDTTKSVINDMLVKNPDHEGALMLMAMGETRAGNYEAARGWVARLRSNIAAKSGDRTEALKSLDAMTATIDAQAEKAKAGVAITVEIEPALLTQIGSNDALFVAISDAQGGPPYAVKRLAVSELQNGQTTLTLSNLDAMLPERTLQSAKDENVSLILTARISKSGNAISESGDLSANPVPLGKDTQRASIMINHVVP